MKITPMKDGSFKVESEHKKGTFYKVYPAQPFCDCPQFMFREIKVEGECKHIKAVNEFIREKKIVVREKIKKKTNSSNIIDFVRQKGEVDSVDLISKFGEEKIDDLLKKAELIEFKGKIKVLE